MTLEQIKDLITLISGDKGNNFSFDEDDFSDMLNNAQLKHFKRKLGLPEDYSPGVPLPRQAYEITERITEDLRPFKKAIGFDLSTPITVDNTDGTIDYPNDYYIITGMTTSYSVGNETYERKVDILSDLEFIDHITSVTKKPTHVFPVCNPLADKIRIAPIDIQTVSMMYLRLPVRPVYAITETNGYPEYDPTNSTELEWDDMNIIDIITILLGDLGIPMKSGDVVSYAENLKAKGV